MTKISTKLKTLFLTIETEVQYVIAHIQKIILFCFHMLIYSYDDYMVADLTKSNFNWYIIACQIPPPSAIKFWLN